MLPVLHMLKFLLLPFAWVYGGVVALRNLLYDNQIFSSYKAPIPVICVGNVTVGGTGKTPQVEYLARLLREHKIAILSRGYKRKSKGFVLADENASADLLGDEPFQYVQSLPWVQVAVCEKRAEGIQQLLRLFPNTAIILLDDAFQHRAVKASFNLLLTDYGRLFTQDYLLPVGRLRESRGGANRADAVVVTKCPSGISLEQQKGLVQQIEKYTRESTPVFFSRIVYAPAVPIGKQLTLGKRLVLVTGIANPEPLQSHLKEEGYEILHHFEWADHTDVSSIKVQEVVAYWQTLNDPEVAVLMTQKDAVKWQTPELQDIWREVPVFYLPIEVAFAPQEPSFDEQIRQGLDQ